MVEGARLEIEQPTFLKLKPAIKKPHHAKINCACGFSVSSQEVCLKTRYGAHFGHSGHGRRAGLFAPVRDGRAKQHRAAVFRFDWHAHEVGVNDDGLGRACRRARVTAGQTGQPKHKS